MDSRNDQACVSSGIKQRMTVVRVLFCDKPHYRYISCMITHFPPFTLSYWEQSLARIRLCYFICYFVLTEVSSIKLKIIHEISGSYGSSGISRRVVWYNFTDVSIVLV